MNVRGRLLHTGGLEIQLQKTAYFYTHMWT